MERFSYEYMDFFLPQSVVELLLDGGDVREKGLVVLDLLIQHRGSLFVQLDR